MSTLREKLVEFRLENSGPKRPAYLLFTNDVMDRMIEAKPRNIEELYAVRGIRKDFVKKYGNAVLNILTGGQAAVSYVPAPIVEAKPLTPKERLWKWWEIAKRPPFEIPPKLVDAIVAANPKTLEELSEIKDMNHVILDRYGKGILKCLNN